MQDSEKYVEQLLTLFNRFSRLVKEAFQDDPRFLTARDKVSRVPVTEMPSLCREYLTESVLPLMLPISSFAGI